VRTIHKYDVGLRFGSNQYRFWIPGGDVTIAKVALQHESPCLWIGVDTTQKKHAWLFTWVATGADREQECGCKYAVYVGTVLMKQDCLVLHGFLHQDPDQSGEPS
jgi:hypothetical protein